MTVNLINFPIDYEQKISRSLAQCLAIWIANSVKIGDAYDMIFISNKIVANIAKISTRTVLRAKNEALNLGLIEIYYNNIAQKDCIRVFAKKLSSNN